ALWSTYFHRFFGPVRTASDIPTGLMPMSRSETCQALWQLFRDPDKTAHPHPRMLTRCLANILHSGYRPKAQYQDAFNYLTRRAVRIRNTHAAAARLVAYGETHFGKRHNVQSSARPIKEDGGAPGRAGQILPRPTQVIFEAGVFTVKKQTQIHHPPEIVAPLFEPRQW